MSETEQLSGLALRRAVAEAVGWEWKDKGNSGYALRHSKKLEKPVAAYPDWCWNDAMLVAHALREQGIVVKISVQLVEDLPELERRLIEDVRSETKPDDLCRALLATLEARHDRT